MFSCKNFINFLKEWKDKALSAFSSWRAEFAWPNRPQWKQFFNKPGRPQEFQQISSFVTSEVERILSPSDLEDVFKSKNEEDSLKARMGYIEFKEQVLKVLKDIAT